MAPRVAFKQTSARIAASWHVWFEPMHQADLQNWGNFLQAILFFLKFRYPALEPTPTAIELKVSAF
jgi:hypothetical protein